MRLTDKEIAAIVQAAKTLDIDARVFLYGSRVDDSKKGGDIDLLVLSQQMDIMDKIKMKQLGPVDICLPEARDGWFETN